MGKETSIVFSDDPAPGRVTLNFFGVPDAEFSVLADSFRAIASAACEQLREAGRLATAGVPVFDNLLAYPIVFSFRHALELQMKALILEAEPIFARRGEPGVDRAKLFTHSLEALRGDVERLFESSHWTWEIAPPHFRTLNDFRRVIGELHDVDPRSFCFRYPVDKAGHAALDDHFEFNLFTFASRMDELICGLGGFVLRAADERYSFRP